MAKTKDTNTEGKILSAAENIFQSKGMDGARMQEIADKAGINKAMLHYYYRSKQLLFEAVFNKAFSLLAPQLNTILNDDSSVEDKIKKFTFNYISFISKHPYLPNFILQELNRNPDFVKKLQSNERFPSLDKFKMQVTSEVEKGNLKLISGEQLFINIISLCVFPFIGSPLIKVFLKLSDKDYKQLMKDRKTEIADFIINSIKA